MQNNYAAVKDFVRHHYRHFNARSVVQAAQGWVDELARGNKMFLTIAGAMSTAELGISLADMIRAGKVHAISCTGANLEEDIFNLVAHNSYHYVANWRALTAEDEMALAAKGLKRVTDTCIPEEEALNPIRGAILKYWMEADAKGESYFPYEYFYKMLLNGDLVNDYQIDPKHSWMLAAAEKNIPIICPGWEDSTLGNSFVSSYMLGKIKNLGTVKTGLHAMAFLADWYRENSKDNGIGFFQIAGGIAGDFPICVVPMLNEELFANARMWSYFCQISDSTTSFGSYSGAIPNEKITWAKLDTTCPKFIIESDASIVAPLIFAYVLAS